MRSTVVGRERVLAELGELVRAARAGAGSVVLLTGEAGIGKSTVAGLLAERARADGLSVLIGRAVVDEGAPAYWPWQRALDAVGLGALLEVGAAGSGAEAVAAARFQLAARVCQALASLAEPGGLLVLIEDVPWADEASVALLRHLAREAPDARIFVLGTARTGEGADIDLPGAQVVRLGPLSVDDIAAGMAALGEEPVHPSWPSTVYRLTGGNPLFVRELVRLLAGDGLLATAAVDIPLPAELRRVALRRMERLSPACRDLLGAASVAGDEVDVGLLKSIVDDAEPLLAEAVEAGVLVDDVEEPGRLRFSHELVRRARYDDLSRTERVAWHRRVGDLIEAAGLAPARASDLARHRVRAAVDEAGRRGAADACAAAARAAADHLAYADATRWYEQAAGLLDGLPREAGDGVGFLLESARCAYRAGQFTESLNRCAEVITVAERRPDPDLAAAAAVVVRGLGGQASVAVIGLCTRAEALIPADEDSARLARVLGQHAYALASIDRLAEAAEWVSRALPMAERSGDADALALALHARYDASQGPDGIAERLAAGAQLRALARQLDPSGRGSAELWSYVWRVEAMLELGAVDELDGELVGLSALVDRLGWPIARWHLLRAHTSRAMIAARYDDAENYAREARAVAAKTEDAVATLLFQPVMAEIMRRTGIQPEVVADVTHQRVFATVMPLGSVQVGLMCLAAGDEAQARALFDQARPQLADYPRNSRWLPTLAFAGELAANLGERATVAACYPRVLPYEGQYLNSATGCGGSVARVLGIMAAALGEHDTAVRHLAAAVTLEQRIGSHGDAAIAQVEQAAALVGRGGSGDRERALVLAQAGQRAAAQFGLAPLGERAAALVQLLAPAGPAARDDDPLTVREREIAALVAEGLSNKAIAGRLYLSERTIETHLRNVLTKLDLTNRTQVAGWFMRTG